MKDILRDIKKSVESDLCFSALFLIVAVPDICAALQSSDNLTSREKYKTWFNTYLAKIRPDKYGDLSNLTAEDFYKIRCSLLHQGQTNNQNDCQRLLFFEPNSENSKNYGTIHCCVVGESLPQKSLLVNIAILGNDICAAAEKWIDDFKNNSDYIKNSTKLIKRHPDGISPVFCPVIG